METRMPPGVRSHLSLPSSVSPILIIPLFQKDDTALGPALTIQNTHFRPLLNQDWKRWKAERADFALEAILVMLAEDGDSGDSDPRPHAALRRADRRRERHAQRRPGSVFRLSGAKRGGEVDHHQDAHRPAGAELRDNGDSGPALWSRRARPQAADRRGAGGDGAAGPAHGARVSALRGPHVRPRPEHRQRAYRRSAGIHAAIQRAQEAGDRLFPWNAKE